MVGTFFENHDCKARAGSAGLKKEDEERAVTKFCRGVRSRSIPNERNIIHSNTAGDGV